jgi:carboxymethylenebutenolidase
MCHTRASVALPEPGRADRITQSGVTAFAYGSGASDHRIVVIPDIYGASPFYRGLSTWYANKGARVFLLDPFAEIGELPEVTREAAFARRAKLRDRACVDAIESFARWHEATGVVGFCLGGLYVFELAHRGLNTVLVSLYGFPQGMPNQEPLPIPFDYLDGLTTGQIAIFGETDYLQTPESFARLKELDAKNSHFNLWLYPKSGHGFLADLDSQDDVLRANAHDALALTTNALLRS